MKLSCLSLFLTSIAKMLRTEMTKRPLSRSQFEAMGTFKSQIAYKDFAKVWKPNLKRITTLRKWVRICNLNLNESWQLLTKMRTSLFLIRLYKTQNLIIKCQGYDLYAWHMRNHENFICIGKDNRHQCRVNRDVRMIWQRLYTLIIAMLQ